MPNTRRIIRIAALALAAVLAASALLGCAKKQGFTVPEGMTREEAALFTAIANVCPKDSNNSKMDYLTFYIAGWSFSKLPDEIRRYLAEYCADGSAQWVDLEYSALWEQGLIAKGDGGFYGEDEDVYAEGRGKIFTFTLGEGQSTDAETCAVSVRGFVSDMDQSGFDVVLNYENGEWKFVEYTNTWNMYLGDPEAGGSTEPSR